MREEEQLKAQPIAIKTNPIRTPVSIPNLGHKIVKEKRNAKNKFEEWLISTIPLNNKNTIQKHTRVGGVLILVHSESSTSIVV